MTSGRVPSPRGWRLGAALLASLLLAGPACSPPKSGEEREMISEEQARAMTETVHEHLRLLDRIPGLLPPEPELKTSVGLYLFEVGAEGKGAPAEVVNPPRGSLRISRELAARRVTPPDYWALVTDEEGSRVLYWAPVETPGRWHGAEHSTEGPPEEALSADPPAGAVVPVLLPATGGRSLVVFYPHEGRDSGIRPEDVLVVEVRAEAAERGGGGP
jgi:hypothetical protein